MGMLITIEGGEYVGKSSVALPFIKTIIEKSGVEVKVSREPGGTPKAEIIRQQIFEKLGEGAPMEEIAILMYKARKMHIDDVIIPFLGKHKEKNKAMILDRYLDSSRIYQGYLGGLPLRRIRELDKEYVQGYLPDITLIMYFPEEIFTETFISRSTCSDEHTSKRDKNKWDTETIEKHLERQRLYLTLPRLAKEWGEDRKFLLINAATKPDAVRKEIIKKLTPLLLESRALKLKYSTKEEFMNAFQNI